MSEVWCNTSGLEIEITSKLNKFYIGDPCYALLDKLYSEVWGGLGYPDGEVKDAEGNPIMIVDATAHGDGCYSAYSEQGCIGCFAVDAGCFSVVPWEYCDHTRQKDIDRLGHTITLAPGTSVRMKTYPRTAGKGWRGRFVWTYTGTDGKKHTVSVSTY